MTLDWVFQHWSDDGAGVRDIRVSKSEIATEIVSTTGAILAGRRWYDVPAERFDRVDGNYDGAWNGPVFVLTHHPPLGENHPAIVFLSGDSPTPLIERAKPLEDETLWSSVPISRSNVFRLASWTKS